MASLGSLSGCLKIPAADGGGAVAEIDPAGPVEVRAGTDIAQLYEVGQARVFGIAQGGQRLGTSWGRYVGPETTAAGVHHRFETKVELNVPGRGQLRSEGALVLDDRGALVSGFERSDAGEVRFHRDGDLVVLEQEGRRDELTYEPHRSPTSVMAHSAIMHEEIMLLSSALYEGTQTRRLISLSGGPPLDWDADVHRRGDDIVVRTSLGETITLREGRLVEIVVPSSELRVDIDTAVAWPSWTLALPPKPVYEPSSNRFTAREVELPGRPEEPALVGEVLIPNASTLEGAAVLYVGSTGQEDRYGRAGSPPVDLGSHAITDALAEAGFIVLRFDERGQGGSADGERPPTFTEQVEDARRAYRTLIVQEEVDPDRVVLVGHGEGGWRVLHVALGRPLSGVALLATPGRPYRNVFGDQSKLALERMPPALRADASRAQQKMLDSIAQGDPPPPELAGQAPWLREMMQQQPGKLLAQIDAPLFLAQGGKDFEVDPKADLEALLKAVPDQARADVHRYPDLDHRFKVEPGRSEPGRYRDDARPVDPTFVADLVRWATEVVARPPAANP